MSSLHGCLFVFEQGRSTHSSWDLSRGSIRNRSNRACKITQRHSFGIELKWHSNLAALELNRNRTKPLRLARSCSSSTKWIINSKWNRVSMYNNNIDWRDQCFFPYFRGISYGLYWLAYAYILLTCWHMETCFRLYWRVCRQTSENDRWRIQEGKRRSSSENKDIDGAWIEASGR